MFWKNKISELLKNHHHKIRVSSGGRHRTKHFPQIHHCSR